MDAPRWSPGIVVARLRGARRVALRGAAPAPPRRRGTLARRGAAPRDPGPARRAHGVAPARRVDGDGAPRSSGTPSTPACCRSRSQLRKRRASAPRARARARPRRARSRAARCSRAPARARRARVLDLRGPRLPGVAALQRRALVPVAARHRRPAPRAPLERRASSLAALAAAAAAARGLPRLGRLAALALALGVAQLAVGRRQRAARDPGRGDGAPLAPRRPPRPRATASFHEAFRNRVPA